MEDSVAFGNGLQNFESLLGLASPRPFMPVKHQFNP